jgi:hypothetical protein
MSFELTHTMLTDHVAELQWAAAPEVGFTYFDSCLGLLGRDGTDVIGVHLVMATDDFFDDEAAALAASVVLRCAEVAVVGNVRLWEDSVLGPFRTMARLIGGAWRPMTDRGRGTYGGRINAGRIQYRYNGVWYNH